MRTEEEYNEIAAQLAEAKAEIKMLTKRDERNRVNLEAATARAQLYENAYTIGREILMPFASAHSALLLRNPEETDFPEFGPALPVHCYAEARQFVDNRDWLVGEAKMTTDDVEARIAARRIELEKKNVG